MVLLAALLLHGGFASADDSRAYPRNADTVYVYGLRAEDNGSSVVTGAQSTGSSSAEAFVLSLDPAGEPVADAVFRVGDHGTYAGPTALREDGLTYLSGLVDNPSPGVREAWLRLVDDSLQERWTLRWQLMPGWSARYLPSALLVEPGSGAVHMLNFEFGPYSGNLTRYHSVVSRISADGRLQWVRSYFNDEVQSRPRGLHLGAGGELILVSGLRSTFSGFTCVARRLAPGDGEVIWEKRIQLSGVNASCTRSTRLRDGAVRVWLEAVINGKTHLALADIDPASGDVNQHDTHVLFLHEGASLTSTEFRPNGNLLVEAIGRMRQSDTSTRTFIVEMDESGLVGGYRAFEPTVENSDGRGSASIGLLASDSWVSAHWNALKDGELSERALILGAGGDVSQPLRLSPNGWVGSSNLVGAATPLGPVYAGAWGNQKSVRVTRLDAVPTDRSYIIDHRVAGAFFNPDLNGQGWFLEPFLVDRQRKLLAAWYTFLDGEPKWLIGVGEIDGNVAKVPLDIATGGDFPPRFSAASVRRQPWGEASFVFDSPDMARVSWTSAAAGYGSGSLALQRLTEPAAEPPLRAPAAALSLRPCHSGSWYDTTQDGHGLMFQVLSSPNGQQLAAIWYAFINGKQTWLLGSGPIVGDSAQLAMQVASGGQFPARGNAPVQLRDWGTLRVKAIDREQLSATWSSPLEGFGAGSLNLTRITRHELKYCD
jgi:hypothetical protein